ncbi:FAS1 domain-containing protein [Endogone sp. FLAS-F59071]|nr:FAS1 domain-containing protein [Endogone sp. FLAS-F59071]|eukprot:RUS14906.1 FAS1 domain-containing protein [Endogone sp. FLAS-F59071]
MKHLVTTLLFLSFLLLSYTPPLAEASTTLIDVLSGDTRFSSLLTNLQHTQLVPYLNKLKIATLFAPTNDAFRNASIEITKEVLLFHVLPVELKGDEFYHGQVLETALVKEGYLGKYGHVGQRIKVEKQGNRKKGRGKVLIGGAQIIESDLEADNGVIQVVDQVLVPPEDIVKTAASVESLKAFSELLVLSGLNSVLSEPRPFTVFVPESAALARFNSIEETYLKSEQGRGDLRTVIEYHVHEGVLFSEEVPSGRSNITTVEGEPLDIKVDKANNIYVDDVEVKTRDVIASNGAIHTLSSLLLPTALQFTARKYLIGLNSSRFVSLLDELDLGYYLDDTTNDSSFTILAPRDEAFEDEDLPARGTPEFKRWLQYHIVPGKKELQDLNDGTLLETELVTQELKGTRQRIKVGVEEEKLWFGGNDKGNTRKDVRFNEAGLVGDPVLPPPSPLLNNVVVDLRLSTFIASLFASDLEPQLRHSPGITLFVPTNDAFAQLGLVTRYLLLPEARNDLQSVIKYHVADRILYSAEIPEGTNEIPTLAGSDLIINKTKNGHIFVHPTGDQEFSLAGNVTDRDILVSTGVVHIVDRVIVPPTLEITNRNLLRGVHASTLLDILKATNLSDLVLGSPVDRHRYTILAPSDKAFARVNLTRLLNDPVALDKIARLHIIPQAVERGDEDRDEEDKEEEKNVPHPLKDGAEYSTLLSGDDKVTIREIDSGRFIVEVSGRRWGDNSAARVIGVGRSQGGGGVIFIDQVLVPKEEKNGGGLPPWATALITIVSVGIVGGGGYYGFQYWRRGREREGYVAV